MADNTVINANTTSGDTIATDDIGGVKFQRIKVTIGADGVNDGDVSSSNPLPISDNSSSLTVDAPVGTPVNVQVGNGTLSAGVIDETGASAVDALAIGGGTAHDAVDSGNPIKIGGKVSTTVPTTIANADRVNAWFDEYGRQVVSDQDVEIGTTIGTTGLRDRMVAQRCTVLADSLADGIAGFWTQTTASGGTIASTVGEGQLKTSTGTTGSAQIVSTNIPYYPGQVAWLNSAVRFGDTGTAGNIRRLGMFTVSGTTPQEGFYYELSGTTLNAVTVKAGTPAAVASGSWSRNSIAPFTLDTNYHSFELRYTANTVWFYIDNVLRHSVSGTSSALTTSLTLPITVTNVKTSGGTDITFAVRNIGNGRFGNPESAVTETGLLALNAIGVGGATPHDSVDSGNPLKIGGYAKTTAPTSVADGDRVNAWYTQSGSQVVTVVPHTSGGWDTFMASSADGSTALTNSAQSIKGSAGKFGGYYIYNPNSVACYVLLYNVASGSVTVGTTNPKLCYTIPATSGANLEIVNGVTFDTAMSVSAVMTTAGGTTAPTTALEANFYYK